MDNTQVQQQREDDASEIDLLELVRVLWSNALIIATGAILVALLVYVFESFFVTPQYTSTAKLLVLKNQSEGLNYTEVQLFTQLTNDCVELIQVREVTEKTIKDLNLRNDDGELLTHEDLLDKMSVSKISDTRMISISVKDSDPVMAQKIAAQIMDNAMDHINKTVFGTTGEEDKVVNKAEAANAPENPSSPHKFRDTVIGGVAGVVIVSAIIIAVHLMDNTIKTSDDIEKYLGLSALGVIPISEEEANAKTKKKKARAKG